MTIPRSTATPTERRTRPRPTVPELARGAMAFVVLLALGLGMPAALWGLGRALRLFEGLGTSNLASALTSPDDGSLFLAALLLVAWVAWLVFAVSCVRPGGAHTPAAVAEAAAARCRCFGGDRCPARDVRYGVALRTRGSPRLSRR
jgi:hypothetical protein